MDRTRGILASSVRKGVAEFEAEKKKLLEAELASLVAAARAVLQCRRAAVVSFSR